MKANSKLINKVFKMRDGADIHEAKVIGVHNEFYIYVTFMWNGNETKPQLATLNELKGKEPMSYRPYNQ
jgi:hypothetical protein